MARPSKSQERRQQILDAFEKVILREGYAKASQRKVAEEAGLNQPMLHHYFSGGDEMLSALLERVVARYRDAMESFAATAESTDISDILQFITSEAFHNVSRQNEVFFALIGQGGHSQSVFEKLASVYQEFYETLKELVRDGAPEGRTDVDKTAYVIMCFVIGHDWAKKLGFGESNNRWMAESLQAFLALQPTR